jgi:hypothetical protein
MKKMKREIEKRCERRRREHASKKRDAHRDAKLTLSEHVYALLHTFHKDKGLVIELDIAGCELVDGLQDFATDLM